MIKIILISFLLIAGSFFSLLAALGMLRFPDIYSRMHAATKAPAFGLLLLLSGVAWYFESLYAWAVCLLSILIIFLTAPVASHALSSIAHRMGVPKYHQTDPDELEQDKNNDNFTNEK